MSSYVYINLKHFNLMISGSVCLSMLARLESRLEIPAGSSTAWSMALLLMAGCPVTRLLEMTPSPPSSKRQARENMSQEPSLWTWSPV